MTFLARDTVATGILWWIAKCCFAAFLLMNALEGRSLAAEPPSVACIVTVDSRTGPVAEMRDLAGGVLVAADTGLFFARRIAGRTTLLDIGRGDTGRVYTMRDFAGRILIGAELGVFVATEASGKPKIDRVSAHTGSVYEMIEFPEVGMLVRAQEGMFVARQMGESIVVSEIAQVNMGRVSAMRTFKNGVLIGAARGLYLATAEGGTITMVQDEQVDSVIDMQRAQGVGVLVRANNGLFLARDSKKAFKVEPLKVERFKESERISVLHDFPGGRVLVGSTGSYLYLGQIDGDQLIFRYLSDESSYVGGRYELYDFPDSSVLIRNSRGWFLIVDAVTEIPTKKEVAYNYRLLRANAEPTGYVSVVRKFSPGGVLMGSTYGLFRARNKGDHLDIEKIGGADTGRVYDMYEYADGMLVQAANGWFVVGEASGKVTVEPAGEAKTGRVSEIRGFNGDGFLLGAEEGLFLTVHAPLSQVQVDIRGSETINGSQVDPSRTVPMTFVIRDHECTRSVDKMGLTMKIIAPQEAPPGRIVERERISRVTPSETEAELVLSYIFDIPDRWSFQTVAVSGGVERNVGRSIQLRFIGREWWERWWKAILASLGTALALANLLVFVLARRSPRAWRLATDDGWNTSVLRIATLALGHWRFAQLWILDLYFQSIRSSVGASRPFLPLPLSTTQGKVLLATDALAPPWKGKHLWVQGGSGMGKTAVFQHAIEDYFRENISSFAAYKKWGCVIVPFAARDFAGSGEDKDEPTWVFNAARATLSRNGLTFSNSTLLTRFLESGTIGIAIDGLNEVDRPRAVAAFCQAYSEAPMIVTSQQEPAGDQFFTGRLPADIRAFTFDLLNLYLKENAETLMERIAASGLQDAIRSGYDVRLIIDLARADPNYVSLPADRMGLYAAVLEAGWPGVSETVRKEQQSLTAAAAWRMVSERKPNEDMRRMRPDVDLPSDLLVALADAPRAYGRSVRLIRRVGAGAFEFVHDQMHAYLAARWFAQDGISASELEKMISGSTIWMQTPEARRTLWGFAAALLDDERALELWARVEDNEAWDVLRRALKAEAERRGTVTSNGRGAADSVHAVAE